MERHSSRFGRRWLAIGWAAIQILTAAIPADGGSTDEAGRFLAGRWSAGVTLKRFFDSHTSYEFGMPFAPVYTPLSRLEFPLDAWWGGITLRGAYPRFSLGLEALASVSDEADGKMRDWDWEDPGDPRVVTTYSESQCRIPASRSLRIDADLYVADWLGLPRHLDIRPVIGFRWQRFQAVAHDGSQYSAGSPTLDLPGDSIAFQQSYYHYFIGLKGDIGLHRWLPQMPVHLRVQADWASVKADNEDLHLLRPGYRLTIEKTGGEAWHGLLGLSAPLAEGFSLDLDVDALWIKTRGTHRLLNEPVGVDFTFDYGVIVWSRQLSCALTLKYTF